MSTCPPGFELNPDAIPRPSPPHDVDFIPYSNGIAPAAMQPPPALPSTAAFSAKPEAPQTAIGTSLHVSSSDLPPSAFIESVNALDQPPIQSDSSFMPDLPSDFGMPVALQSRISPEVPPTKHSSASPPHPGHISSPPMAMNGQVFSTSSSLQTAMDPSGLPQRSRSNTLNSSPVLSLSSNMSVSQPLAPTSYSPPAESLSSIKQEGSVLANASMLLEQIAHTATSGSLACQMNEGDKASFIIQDIREQVSKVTSILNGVSSMSLEDHSPPLFADYLSPPSLGANPASDLAYPPPDSSNPNLSLHESDNSRKRCASALDAERPLKSLKAEPPEEGLHIDANAIYVPPAGGHPPSSGGSQSSDTTNFVFNPVKQRPPSGTVVSPYSSSVATSPDMMDITGSQCSLPSSVMISQPSFPLMRNSWSDSVVTRHAHSSSTGSISSSTAPGAVQGKFIPPALNGGGIVGRMSRSGSLTGNFTNPFQTFPPGSYQDPSAQWPSSGMPTPASDTFPLRQTVPPPMPASAPPTWPPRSKQESDDNSDDSDDEGSPLNGNATNATELSSGPSSSGSELPPEYRLEVDRIFFEYLNKICSNLDATDSKGEAIHQTLMAKKMQRLDESKDFRPFKFRIQAFTLAFLEELARQGYPEEKIPMKKVRHYLWRQQYILRFNEDGKKAKSKGNHIWNIEAKKVGDGKWEFRPFYRRLAGTLPGIAYCGLRWSWTPRVWDPQASWQNVPVHYSSPSLPPWLSWKDDVLSGIPGPDAQSCDITVVASFVLDGQEGQLTHTFHLAVAPVTTMDPAFSRPAISNGLAGNVNNITHHISRVSSQTLDSGRVANVLHNAAQRANEETRRLSVHTPAPVVTELVKQKQVLDQTVSAFDQMRSGTSPSQQSHQLAVAATEVVAEAAITAVGPRGMSNALTTNAAVQSASVNDMAHFTQNAIATAVKIIGSNSPDMSVVVAAKDLLVQTRRADALPKNTVPSQAPPQLAGIPTRPPHLASNPYPSIPVSDVM